MLKQYRFPLLLILIIGGVLFFFLKNEERYLKETTLKILKLASAPSQTTNVVALLKRVEQIAKHVHFDIQFKVQGNGQTWENHSASEFRSLLLIYFKQGGISHIKGEDLTVQVDPSAPIGHVRFKLLGQHGPDPVSCKVHLVWTKEKKWFIKNLEVFSCSPTIPF